jgi:hypothetical protein
VAKGLRESSAEIKFLRGIQEGENPLTIPSDSVALATNMYQAKSGAWRVRPGLPIIGDLDGPLESSTQIFGYRGRVYGIGPHFIQSFDEVLDGVRQVDHVPEFTLTSDVVMTGGHRSLRWHDITYRNGYHWSVALRDGATDDLSRVIVSQYQLTEEGSSKLVHERSIASGTAGTITRTQIVATSDKVVVTWRVLTSIFSATFTGDLDGAVTIAEIIDDSPGHEYFLYGRDDIADYWVAYVRGTGDGSALSFNENIPGWYEFSTVGLQTDPAEFQMWGSGGGGGSSSDDEEAGDGGDGASGAHLTQSLDLPAGTIGVMIGSGGSGASSPGALSSAGGGGGGGGLTAVVHVLASDDFTADAVGSTVFTSGLTNEGDYDWTIDTGQSPNWASGTGPSNGVPDDDFYLGSQSPAGRYVVADSSVGTSGQAAILETPNQDQSGGASTAFIAFNLHRFFNGETDGTIEVQAWNGAAYIGVWTRTGQEASSHTARFETIFLHAHGFTDAAFRWRIVFTRGADAAAVYDVALSNVKWGRLLAVVGSGGGGGGAGGGDAGFHGGAGGAGGDPGLDAEQVAAAGGDGATGTLVGDGGGDDGGDGNNVIGGAGGSNALGIASIGAGGLPGGGLGGRPLANDGGGGGGGAGYFGGGGGGSSIDNNDTLPGGGGGGSSYTIGGTVTDGTGQTPPNTGNAGYIAGTGTGGEGGTNNSLSQQGSLGGPGAVYLNIDAIAAEGLIVERFGVTAYSAVVDPTVTEITAVSLATNPDDAPPVIWVAYADDFGAGSEVRYAVVDIDSSAIVLANSSVDPNTGDSRVPFISIAIRESDNRGVVAYSTAWPASTERENYPALRHRDVRITGPDVADDINRVVRGQLQSQLWQQGGRMYCAILLQDADQHSDPQDTSTTSPASSPLLRQSTFALIDIRAGDIDRVTVPSDGSISYRLVSIFGFDEAIRHPQGHTSHTAFVGTTSLALSTVKALPELSSQFINTVWPPDASVYTFNPSDTALWRGHELGPHVYFPSCLPAAFDGTRLFEIGWTMFPEIYDITAIDGGSAPQAGTYRWCTTYAHIDECGHVWRSQPSNVVEMTIAGPAFADVRVSTLVHTARQDNEDVNEQNIRIELWRTLEGQLAGPFYHVSSTLNLKHLGTRVIRDSRTDAEIADNEQLYTTGGVLEVGTPPAARYATVWKNRLCLTCIPNGRDTWISREYVRGEGIAFNEDIQLRADTHGGSIRGIFVLGDLLLVGKRDRWYRVYGEPQNDIGELGQLTDNQLLTTEVGISDGEFAVTLDEGILYYADRGWYLLGLGGQTEYIGSPFEDTFAAHPNIQFIIKQRDTPYVLIGIAGDSPSYRVARLDLEERVWSIDLPPGNSSSFGIVSACHVLGANPLRLLDVSGNLRHEVVAVGDSATQPVTGTLITPWYAFAGEGGWFRSRWIQPFVRGLPYSSVNGGLSNMLVDAAVEFDETWTNYTDYDLPAAEIGVGVSLRFKTLQQPTQAVKVRFILVQRDDDLEQDGEPPEITGFRAVYAQRGHAKIRAARTGKE